MSRGAVKARKEAAELAKACALADAELRQIEADAAVDALLVRCVICSLEQVASGMDDDGDSPTQRCFRCGSRMATFVKYLPGHAWYARAGAG